MRFAALDASVGKVPEAVVRDRPLPGSLPSESSRAAELRGLKVSPAGIHCALEVPLSGPRVLPDNSYLLLTPAGLRNCAAHATPRRLQPPLLGIRFTPKRCADAAPN